MHLNPDHIDLLVAGLLSAEEQSMARDHIRGCPRCSALLKEAERLLQSGKLEQDQALSDKATTLLNLLRPSNQLSRVVMLHPHVIDRTEPTSWAADGVVASPDPSVKGILTLLAEASEIIARIYRDQTTHHDYLQVITGDPECRAPFLVEDPLTRLLHVSDPSGRVDLGESKLRRYDKTCPWSVWTANAIFEIDPLKHDLKTSEGIRSLVLESECGSAIEISARNDSSEGEIVLRVLQVEERTEFTPAVVLLTQNGQSIKYSVEDDSQLYIHVDESKGTHTIRVFVL